MARTSSSLVVVPASSSSDCSFPVFPRHSACPAIIHYTEGVRGLRFYPWRLVAYASPFPPSLAGSAAAAGEGHLAQFFVKVIALLFYIAILSGLLWRRFAAQYRGGKSSVKPSAGSSSVRREAPRPHEAKLEVRSSWFSASGGNSDQRNQISRTKRFRSHIFIDAAFARALVQFSVCGKASSSVTTRESPPTLSFRA